MSGQQPRLSTLQESETIIRDKGQTPPKDTETKWRGFDTSRLDQEKFYALVHDLLRDRSRGPDGQLPDHDSSLSLFLIIGWFSGGSSDPYERQVEFKDDEHLFTRLRQEERRIRGWRVYLSLKSLSQFGLYKVCSCYVRSFSLSAFDSPPYSPLSANVMHLKVRYSPRQPCSTLPFHRKCKHALSSLPGLQILSLAS